MVFKFTRTTKARLVTSLLTFLAVATCLNVDRLFQEVVPSLVVFQKQNLDKKVSWGGSAYLVKGSYYLSMGRPQGSCNLTFNQNVVDSSAGNSLAGRSALILGSKIEIENPGNASFSLICDESDSSPNRLVHAPYLGEYRSAMSIHLLRIVTDQYLPTLAVFFILILLIMSLRTQQVFLPPIAMWSAFCAFFYLISLCNIPYLLMSSRRAFLLHVILKLCFVSSMLSWIFTISRARQIIVGLHIIIFFFLIRDYFIAPTSFLPHYHLYVHLIPVLGVACMMVSLRSSRSVFYSVLPVALPFTVFSIFDCISLDFGKGGYLAVASSLSIFGLATRAHFHIENAKSIARKAISIMASKQLDKLSTTDSLSQITMIIAECLKLKDWNVYVDAYHLGSAAKPGRELIRISSASITNGTEQTRVVIEGIENESSMKTALISASPIVSSENLNGEILVTIPIGDKCCLNLTTPGRSKYSEEFVKTFIDEAFQQINSIALTILKFESTASFSVTLLKEELGVGTHELEFGAIFADAIGYTQNVKSSKSFIEFFERDYVSSLLRNLDKKVVLKDLFGDELYLVVLPKRLTTANAKDIYSTTIDVVELIQDFATGKGSELCIAAGYKPIEFRIGANAGAGQIVVGHSNVALSGPVIEAKRCQGRANASQPFVTLALLNSAREEIQQLAHKETYAAKKEILDGYRLSFKKKVA